MITVIVPYRNAERYISETINSILAQTYTKFELVCVDNGSTDTSAAIVNDLIHSANPSNIPAKNISFPAQGKCIALNYALCQSDREWVAICDADDIWDQRKLEAQTSLISESVDVIGTQMCYIGEDGEPMNNAPYLPCENNEILHSIIHKRENPICNSSVLYRRAVHTVWAGFYDPLCVVEDYDLWSRCAFAGLSFINHPDVLVNHRIHTNSNFNSSQKQALHKNLVDGRNDAWKQIEAICNKEV